VNQLDHSYKKQEMCESEEDLLDFLKTAKAKRAEYFKIEAQCAPIKDQLV
jgi:hypothetical protein